MRIDVVDTNWRTRVVETSEESFADWGMAHGSGLFFGHTGDEHPGYSACGRDEGERCVVGVDHSTCQVGEMGEEGESVVGIVLWHAGERGVDFGGLVFCDPDFEFFGGYEGRSASAGFDYGERTIVDGARYFRGRDLVFGDDLIDGFACLTGIG